MSDTVKPGLFGLKHSNRDFTKKKSWGKNQFNSAFPASLCCYLESRQLEAVYLIERENGIKPSSIAIGDVFGCSSVDPAIYFAFEAQHAPFQRFVIGSLPRTDLVIQKEGTCISGLEVKLTAIPDNTTCDLSEENYGSEIVVRPDTIVYLACSLAESLTEEQLQTLPDLEIERWSVASQVLPHLSSLIYGIEQLVEMLGDAQQPFLLQPIWKTQGKSPVLASDCLDVFVWSNAAFCRFVASIARAGLSQEKIPRQVRTVVWLYRMLLDIQQSEHGQFDHQSIIDQLSYGTRNDKAFASSGRVTNRYMRCPELRSPRIEKEAIRDIVLGGGQELLRPERRFDAILVNAPELFA